jgi:2Fe-2S iron-sulfur cluster binding domain
VVFCRLQRTYVILDTEPLYCSAHMSEPSPEATTPAPIETDLLDPYERLVKIEILGKEVQVPEKNRLLRCFQYLSINTISYGDFCWNGDCTNCQVWYHGKGQSQTQDKPALACRMEVIEGMIVTTLSPFIELEGITK